MVIEGQVIIYYHIFYEYNKYMLLYASNWFAQKDELVYNECIDITIMVQSSNY